MSVKCKACNGVGTDGGHRCTSLECCGSCEECDGTGSVECEGHPPGPYDPMGQTVYCNGSCRNVRTARRSA